MVSPRETQSGFRRACVAPRLLGMFFLVFAVAGCTHLPSTRLLATQKAPPSPPAAQPSPNSGVGDIRPLIRMQAPAEDAAREENETTSGEAPPTFLLPGLRRWIHEDDPDGSLEGEEHEDQLRPRSEPRVDIRHPDPDTANFPNSAFTLPQGRVYIETSPVSFYGPSSTSARIYNWEFLFRYGLTDRLEFRLFSNGYTNQYTSFINTKGNPLAGPSQPATSGFSPLAWDLKFHLWDEYKKYYLPAVGMEVYIETNMGSPAFSQGTQPSINLLFDQNLPLDFQLEWNAGIAGNQTVDNTIFYNFAFQWSLQHYLFTDNLAIFTHGYLNNSALPRFAQASNPRAADVAVAGAGALYYASDRLAVFGSYNWGMTPDSPDYLVLFGFAFAL